MNYIWIFLTNTFNYFNIFNLFKKEPIESIVEDVDKIDDVSENVKPKSHMEHYLVHNDPNVMSEWDYLVRLHIR